MFGNRIEDDIQANLNKGLDCRLLRSVHIYSVIISL